jgi:hypothetical protein
MEQQPFGPTGIESQPWLVPDDRILTLDNSRIELL